MCAFMMVYVGIVEGIPFHLDPSQMDLEIMEIRLFDTVCRLQIMRCNGFSIIRKLLVFWGAVG